MLIYIRIFRKGQFCAVEKNSVFGELLYIGLVLEKGRFKSSGLWTIKYKKNIKKHIKILMKLAKCIKDEFEIEEDNNSLKKICIEINCDYELRKYYPFKFTIDELCLKDKIITSCKNENRHIEIIIIVIKLLEDFLSELNKGFKKNKKKIGEIIFSLHNLPRVYLNKEENTLCSLHQDGITVNEALEYSILSMGVEMRLKYSNFLIFRGSIVHEE